MPYVVLGVPGASAAAVALLGVRQGCAIRTPVVGGGAHSGVHTDRARSSDRKGRIMNPDLDGSGLMGGHSKSRAELPPVGRAGDPTIPEPPVFSSGIPALDDVLGCGGLVPGGSYFLSAEPGSGKSALALTVAIEVARSGKRALYASTEQLPVRIQQRLRRDGWGEPNSLVYTGSDTYREASLITTLAERESVSLLVVDSLQQVERDASNKSEQQRHVEVLNDLNAFASECAVALLVVSQATKRGVYRGSSQLGHACDVHLEVHRGRDPLTRFVSPSKNRFAPAGHRAPFQFDDVGRPEFIDPVWAELHDRMAVEALPLEFEGPAWLRFEGDSE